LEDQGRKEKGNHKEGKSRLQLGRRWKRGGRPNLYGGESKSNDPEVRRKVEEAENR